MDQEELESIHRGLQVLSAAMETTDDPKDAIDLLLYTSSGIAMLAEGDYDDSCAIVAKYLRAGADRMVSSAWVQPGSDDQPNKSASNPQELQQSGYGVAKLLAENTSSPRDAMAAILTTFYGVPTNENDVTYAMEAMRAVADVLETKTEIP